MPSAGRAKGAWISASPANAGCRSNALTARQRSGLLQPSGAFLFAAGVREKDANATGPSSVLAVTPRDSKLRHPRKRQRTGVLQDAPRGSILPFRSDVEIVFDLYRVRLKAHLACRKVFVGPPAILQQSGSDWRTPPMPPNPSHTAWQLLANLVASPPSAPPLAYGAPSNASML
jgi:hypothetical protein